MSTSKSIFRPIKDGDDVTDIVCRCVVALIIFAGVFMLLIAGWAMYRDTVRREAGKDSFHRGLIEQEADPAWREEWKRLHKKHGKPGTVIYEPDRDPYYINAAGQKCRFM